MNTRRNLSPVRKNEREQARLTINTAARELVATTKIVKAATRDPASIGNLVSRVRAAMTTGGCAIEKSWVPTSLRQ